jgi:hypothetical protein
MTAPVSNIPLSVDYTSRDYYSLREDLINLVKQRVNQNSTRQWSGDDPSDFGVALIEAFAYVGDLTNYYIDRIANETYLPTASQRKSIINLASLYGYSATGYRAATLKVTFTNTDTNNAYSAAISTASGNGVFMTYTSNGHSFNVGDYVTITGVTPTGYNLTNRLITSKTTNTFSIAGTFTTAYTSGGTAVKSYFIPEGTQVSGTVICDDVVEEVIFTTLEPAYVPPAIGASLGEVQVYAEHGESVDLRSENIATGPNDVAGELLGTSDGTANQLYVLAENQVVEETLEIYAQSGDIYEPWTKVTHIADYGPSDAVYTTQLDENNFVYVIFGDGISGAIPNNMAGIKAVYRVGGGTIGNIAAGTLDTIQRIPGQLAAEVNALTEFISVSNPVDTLTNSGVGIGGAEPEDNRSIRRNASRALRTSNRAVSLQDYADLALLVGNVGKANATAAVWTSATLYIAPIRNVNDLDKFPGKDGSNTSVTTEWTEIQAATQDFFADKTLIGATLTIAPPTYVPASIGVTFTKNDQYTAEQASDEIKQTIVNSFGYAYLDFEQAITPEQIEAALNGLTSIKSAKLTALYRTGSTSVRAPLIGAPSEIFVFLENGITVVEASSEARLSNIVSSAGTLSPTFDKDFYIYNLVGVTGNITLTPTQFGSGSTILVNGVVTASGSASATLTIPIGITSIPVIVTAGDGTTVKVYTVTVSRNS